MRRVGDFKGIVSPRSSKKLFAKRYDFDFGNSFQSSWTYIWINYEGVLEAKIVPTWLQRTVQD
jgi:hypothetical protein